MKSQSVAEILGPWVDSDWDSGLVERIRQAWNIPINELSNEMLATFLRQKIAEGTILQEARKRLAAGFDDDSELYEGELAETVKNTVDPSADRGAS